MIKVLIISTLIFLFVSCSSKEQKFKIDDSISSSIDSTFKENILFDSRIKSEFSFHVVKNFDYERFKENGIDLSYFLRGASFEPSDQYVNSITRCYLSKDTIVLVGGLFYESGVAFSIKIFDDKINSQFILTATDKIYSKTNQKGQLLKEITLDSDSLSMILSQQPVYQNGSILKGKLKLKTQPFYQLDKDNILVKIKPEFDIIFDTKVKEKEID